MSVSNCSLVCLVVILQIILNINLRNESEMFYNMFKK